MAENAQRTAIPWGKPLFQNLPLYVSGIPLVFREALMLSQKQAMH